LSSWARVGAKCVCVDGSARVGSRRNLPVEGKTYTVASVEWCVWLGGHSGIGVHIAEIDRPPHSSGKVYPWGLDRFRPLVTKTQDQDVAMFKSLLTPAPELVE